MSEFKVGDKVTVTASNKALRNHLCNAKIKLGSSHVVTGLSHRGEPLLDDLTCGYVKSEFINLAAPKWSIYNNDLPWEKLSNKQKGKMLLAAHSGVKFEGVVSNPPAFDCVEAPYTAIKPEPVKSRPTMSELFIADFWKDCLMKSLEESAKNMIAKGWAKPCK